MPIDASEMRSKMRDAECFLKEHKIDSDDRDLLLKRSFNEAWFSNMLAWLLDPRGSHKLGTEFLRAFLRLLAQRRSSPPSNKEDPHYLKKGSFLKWGKEGTGRVVSGLALGNASIAREFFLSSQIGKSQSADSGYCDLVILDLDSSDGLFVVIENKLFTTNHDRQLEIYQTAVERKYRRAKIREFVYLTFYGFEPQGSDGNSDRIRDTWLRCSWVNDIASLIEQTRGEKTHPEVLVLLTMLNWMRAIRDHGGDTKASELRLQILQAAAFCLAAELNRLVDGNGEWKAHINGARISLTHSGNPKSPLFLELLPSLSVAVQGHRSGKATFSKIIVPYGVNADQIFNLLDIAARDILIEHFGDRAKLYLTSGRRRLQSHQCETKRLVKPLFDFVSAHADSLRVLFAVSHLVWRQGTTTRSAEDEEVSADSPSQIA